MIIKKKSIKNKNNKQKIVKKIECERAIKKSTFEVKKE